MIVSSQLFIEYSLVPGNYTLPSRTEELQDLCFCEHILPDFMAAYLFSFVLLVSKWGADEKEESVMTY
jgi:hypothetical protein